MSWCLGDSRNMDLISLITISIALSMDAFSVSICQGLATKKFSVMTALSCGLWFGVFQALMPLIGYFLGAQFEHFITQIDHWIAFGLLVVIGVNMIRESISQGDNETISSESPSRDVTHYTDEDKRDASKMLMLAIATSIDAFAVGITFAFLKVNIWKSILVIGITTFLFSFVGVRIGNIFGSRYSKIAEIIGGTILIILGIKILVEHLWF